MTEVRELVKSYDDAVKTSEDALELQNQGEIHKALELWRSVARYDPEFDIASAFEHIGEILEELGDIANAEKAYRAAIAFQPGYDMYILNYAGFLAEHAKAEQARPLYEILRRGTGNVAETADRCARLLETTGAEAPNESQGAPTSLSDIKFSISESELREILGD
jgi:tetratricopeptide (TPR) repeat protein